jgi:hypothetical protein
VTIWRKIDAWSGEASVQTEFFPSNTGSFRVKWTAENLNAERPGRLTISLNSAVSGRPLVYIAEKQGAGGATAYVNEDPRDFFFVIDAERIRWTLALEEGLPGTQQVVDP